MTERHVTRQDRDRIDRAAQAAYPSDKRLREAFGYGAAARIVGRPSNAAAIYTSSRFRKAWTQGWESES